MEGIKKEKNIHMYFMVSIVLAMFMEIYAFLMRLNLLNIFLINHLTHVHSMVRIN